MAKPGQLDQIITLQRQTTADDGAGGLVKSWSLVAQDAQVWAQVLDGSGDEKLEAQRDNATSFTTFVIRNRTDLSEKNRIVWNGENYNIRQIMRLGARAMYLHIKAERGVAT